MKYNEITKQIEKRRQSEGKTQAEFAKQFKISQSYYCEIISGKRQMGEEVMKRFGYKADYIKCKED